MSQIQSFIQSMGPAGPILTLTGDIGGAVGPDGAGNINIRSEFNPTGYGFASIEGTPLSNRLDVTPINATVTTNDATTTTIYQLTLANNTAAIIRARIIALRDDFSNMAGGDIIIVGRKPGAGAVTGLSSGQVLTDYIGNPPPTAGGGSDATHLLVRVRGTAGEVWNWTAAIMYQFELL